MKKFFPKWIFFLTSRYLFNKKRKSTITVNIIASLLLIVGVAVLLVVISIMNGMQIKFIDDLLDVSSYHLQATANKTYKNISKEDIEKISQKINENPQVESVFEFIDADVIIKYEDNDYGCMVRGLPEHALTVDKSFKKSISMYLGEFDLSQAKGIVIGRNMHQRLGNPFPGSTIRMLVFKEGRIVNPIIQEYTITGIYQTSYIEIENSMVFMNIADVADFASLTNLKYGIKINNRNKDQEVLRSLSKNEELAELKIDTWRSYNKSFFGALKMEKVAMMFLLGMIVFIVAFSLYYSFKRVVFEKNRDIAILRSFGATPVQVKIVFILEGLVIGFFGSFVGVILGLLITVNFQSIMNFMLSILYRESSFYYEAYANQKPNIFIGDVFIIYYIALFAPAVSAYLASKRVTEIKPAEVLRYE